MRTSLANGKARKHTSQAVVAGAMCADGSQAVGQRPVLARCGRCHALPSHSALLNYPLKDVPMDVSFRQLVPKVLSGGVLQGNVARLEVRCQQHPLPRHRLGQKVVNIYRS